MPKETRGPYSGQPLRLTWLLVAGWLAACASAPTLAAPTTPPGAPSATPFAQARVTDTAAPRAASTAPAPGPLAERVLQAWPALHREVRAVRMSQLRDGQLAEAIEYAAPDRFRVTLQGRLVALLIGATLYQARPTAGWAQSPLPPAWSALTAQFNDPDFQHSQMFRDFQALGPAEDYHYLGTTSAGGTTSWVIQRAVTAGGPEASEAVTFLWKIGVTDGLIREMTTRTVASAAGPATPAVVETVTRYEYPPALTIDPP